MIFQLFSIFFKIGTFTIGGGYAMIPLIENEIVNKKQWIDYLHRLSLARVEGMHLFGIGNNTAVVSHHPVHCLVLSAFQG